MWEEGKRKLIKEGNFIQERKGSWKRKQEREKQSEREKEKKEKKKLWESLRNKINKKKKNIPEIRKKNAGTKYDE